MRNEVELWLKQAEDDFESALFNFEGKKYYVAAFLSQQTVEKALKALYIQTQGQLLKTHNVSKLAIKLNLSEALVLKIATLEPVYQESRYPDVSPLLPSEEFNRKDVEEFLKIAEEVIKWVKKKL